MDLVVFSLLEARAGDHIATVTQVFARNWIAVSISPSEAMATLPKTNDLCHELELRGLDQKKMAMHSNTYRAIMSEFHRDVTARIAANATNKDFYATAAEFMRASVSQKYSYNFSWQGCPIIQYPQDIVAVQELVWSIKPDLIIETGIAHGGSLIFSASMLALLDICDAIEAGERLDPKLSPRKVLGIDIDIRTHNREAIEAHPMASRIQMIEGSSIAPEIIEQVRAVAANHSRVLVCLDSNHTHDHVLAELQAYAPLTSKGSYCIVFDTVIEDMPKEMFPDRPWGPGDNPKTAVWEYLKTHPEFEIDKSIPHKLVISVAPDGYLKRIL